MAQAQDNIKDPRTLSVMNGIQKTSLSDFLNKTSEKSDDDTSGDISSTDAVEPDAAPQSEDAKPSDDSGSDSKVEDKPVAEDQIFDVKGQKVPLKDLLNSFETRQEISKRFDEVGKKEAKIRADAERIKKAQDELSYIDEKFKEMSEEIQKGNPLNALTIAMTMANAGEESKNPDVLELVKQAQAIAENFAEMDEDAQKVFIKNQEVERREKKLAKKEANDLKAREEEAIRNYYTGLLDTHKVTDAELDVVYEDIQKLPKYKEQLENIPTQKERIDYCVAWLVGKRWNEMIGDAIASVDEKLSKDQTFRLALIEGLDPHCTKEDVVGVVNEYLATQNKGSAKVESEASTKDVETKTTTPDRAPPEKAKAEKETRPIMSWDDIKRKHGIA